jgi:hypothetical protein
MWLKVASSFNDSDWSHDISIYMTRCINPTEENTCWCEFTPTIDCTTAYFVFIFSQATIVDYQVYGEH